MILKKGGVSVQTFVVIGLGRFGSSVAEELCALGHQVLAVDVDERAVQRMADKVTQAVTADCQDPEVLQTLGVKRMDCAVVAFSDDIGTSVLVALNLKELGIPRLVCKARSDSHQELLKRIGADQVVFPERESGRNLARTLDNREILNYIPLADHSSMVKTPLPGSWQGRSLGELDVFRRYQVYVTALQRADGTFLANPQPEAVFRPGDVLFLLGDNRNIETVISLE